MPHYTIFFDNEISALIKAREWRLPDLLFKCTLNLYLREPTMINSGSETISGAMKPKLLLKAPFDVHLLSARATRDKFMGTLPQSKDEYINLRLKRSAKKILSGQPVLRARLSVNLC